MEYAVLDTNFILSCMRKKIDFFSVISEMGIKIVIPNEVLAELRKFETGGKKTLQTEAKIALSFLEQNDFSKINLNAKNTDNGIVALARRNRDYIIATLDREIKSKISNRKMIIRGEKNLEIIP